MDSESPEVWAPLHAWRTLGQLGSSQAVDPLLNQFNRLCEDDWALPELSTVMGMLGKPAIEPLLVEVAAGLLSQYRADPAIPASRIALLRQVLADLCLTMPTRINVPPEPQHGAGEYDDL